MTATDQRTKAEDRPDGATHVTRRDADFESRGTRCAAWLYRPEGAENPPVVVMAHGFGGERDWGLPGFAERFAGHGIATLLFDYRRFGDSDGEPRNLITPTGHVRDYLAAISHVRGIEDVDGDRLALWGTSFSGGHAITAAARDGDVDAVVAQVPFTDGLATVAHLARTGEGGLGYLARTVGVVLRDVGRKLTGRSPHYVPIVGQPGDLAVLNPPGTLEGVESIAVGEWENRCPARIFATVLGYRPIAEVDEVDCPTLVVEAEEDNVTLASTVDRLVERLGDVAYERYPYDHWQIFDGEPLETVAAREAAFLEEHLLK